MDRDHFENDIMCDPKETNVGKAGRKNRLLRRFWEGFETAIPFLVVWVLILVLMAGGAAFRHAEKQNQPSQASKAVTVFQFHKI
jgi:tryptophan-rich sensory protein